MFAVLCVAAGVTFAEELANEKFGFVVTIPNEFQQSPVSTNETETLYSFVRPAMAGKESINITIQRMRGVIGREPLPPVSDETFKGKLPEGSKVAIYRDKWRGYPVEGLEVTIPSAATGVVSRGVQIPLRREAIEIAVAGPTTADTEITGVLKDVLASLKGASNWDPKPPRKPLAGEKGTVSVMCYLLLAIGIVVVIIVAASRKKS
jgi:hypothetical protein